MERKGNIVSYTAEELAAMRARGEGETDWAAVDAKTEEELAADTASDPAWDGIPEDWFKHARAASGPLIRPKENKRLVSVRYDADVIERFKGQGRGWQARMNAVLRSFMEQSRNPR
jgi:uncharacterized protein (DUF4415 family)